MKKRALLTLPIILFFTSQLFAQKVIIHAGQLIDGISDDPVQNVTVTVQDGQITAVENGFIDPSDGTGVVDLSNQTLMPGWIDLHVHLENETSPTRYLDSYRLNDADIAFQSAVYAKKTLMAGFTTVRDLGGTGVNIALRDAINKGYTLGPRVITVGKSIATTGGHADPTNGRKNELMGRPGPTEGVVNGPFEAREAVRQRYKNGADHIKITSTGGVLSVAKSGQNPQFLNDELAAIVETAQDYEMHVAAHAHGEEGMLRAVDAGVLTIEHGTYMSERVMDRMIEKGAYYVPTISAGNFVAEKAEIDGYYPEIVVPKAKAIGPQITNTFAKAYAYGVPIAFGTDAGVFPHGENAKEFGYMVEAGMPVMDVIQSATTIAAKVLGLENEIGQVAPGFTADLVAVPGNPFESIEVMERPSFIMKSGDIVHQP
ncbi:MAG: amidohydrolase family protein [Balneolaceae bacterium]|nr:amidohydrolase family protein [Balneolaceae bacterium]